MDDLIDGMIRLMNGEHTGPINIEIPEFTIRQLAELVREKINLSLDLYVSLCPKMIHWNVSQLLIWPNESWAGNPGRFSSGVGINH